MMGAALGLAVLASVPDSRTESVRDSGDGLLVALTGGYNAALLAAAAFAVTGALGVLLLRRVAPSGRRCSKENPRRPSRRPSRQRPEAGWDAAQAGRLDLAIAPKDR
jgi:hypothetical protein